MGMKQTNGMQTDQPPAHPTGRWLLLMPQVPDGDASARVQVWRVLSRSGAALLRNGVWLLPSTPERQQQASALTVELAEQGAQCVVLAASLVDGLSDAEIERLFRDARTLDYDALHKELTKLQRTLVRAAARRPAKRASRTNAAHATPDAAARRKLVALERRLAELRAITFVATPRQRDVELLLAELRAQLIAAPGAVTAEGYRGRTWVTRRGVFVDRIASAWLIRRFIDPTAIFRFIDPALEAVSAGELRFDIRGGEFGHEEDRCTFETLCVRFSLDEPGHRAIGEMVHDLDCRDLRYQRPETAGLRRLLDGIAAETLDDLARIERATPMLDLLFTAFATSAASPHSTP